MKLVKGDCLEEMAKLSDQSIDLVLTDPPYGTTACKWDNIIPLDKMWYQLKRIIKPRGIIILTASQPFTTTLISSNIAMFKYCWIWNKVQNSSFALANKQPLRCYEDICIFYTKFSIYKPQMTLRDKPMDYRNRKGDGKGENARFGSKYKVKKIYTHSYPKNILTISSTSKECNPPKKIHPTQKPIALMEYLIKTYTNENDIVLDFAMGSGTTGVACRNLKRQFTGIELDTLYFDIAKKRIEKSNETKER